MLSHNKKHNFQENLYQMTHCDFCGVVIKQSFICNGTSPTGISYSKVETLCNDCIDRKMLKNTINTLLENKFNIKFSDRQLIISELQKIDKTINNQLKPIITRRGGVGFNIKALKNE